MSIDIHSFRVSGAAPARLRADEACRSARGAFLPVTHRYHATDHAPAAPFARASRASLVRHPQVVDLIAAVRAFADRVPELASFRCSHRRHLN